MNWGNKIIILYLSFVVLIVAMAFMSMNQQVDLVSADYYEKELKFQDKIDGENNFKLLDTVIAVRANKNTLDIIFPKQFIDKDIVGNILIYRPSDASMDIKTPIGMEPSAQQQIVLKNFKRGLYKIQLDWAMQGKKYFYEQNLFMN